jgi:outer membrane receptor protein involved in Fe transport
MAGQSGILTKLAITIFWTASSLLSSAQNIGSVSGIVTNGESAIEFANVYITTRADSTQIIALAVTDSTGYFTIQNLGNGSYLLNISLVGSRRKQIPIVIEPSAKNINIQELQLETDALVLNAVEVTELRSIIQKTDDGFILDAGDNITQIGGTAADLLKNLPGILVSGESEITLRGKTPLILINGRTSGIAGIDRSARLEQIPASSIERIEIINNPSAKYDADAEGGIINIKLKSNDEAGTNGAFAIGLGFGERYRLNGSMLLNRKTNKWNFGIAYDNWYTTRTRRVRGDRINFDIPEQYFLTQRRFDERLILYQNAKGTVEYSPSDKSRLSFEALWAFPGEDNNETLRNNFETSENQFSGRNKRHSNEIRRSHALEFSVNYAKWYTSPEHSLQLNLSNTFGNDKENTDITTQLLDLQDFLLSTAMQQTHTYQKTNLSNISLDYKKPLSPKGSIEAGYKAIVRYLNADFRRASSVNGEFVIDARNTNIFNFDEQIHSVYTQYNGWSGRREQARWKYSLGLRAEQVWNYGENKDETDGFSNKYFVFFPSGSLTYYAKNENNIKLSYSRRINRPGLGQLNPFTDITDSLNQRSGNPHLKPELANSMEIGYYVSSAKASLSISGFYRTRTNAILVYTILDENGASFTQPINFGKATTYGAEAISSLQPFSWWGLDLSLSAYEFSIEEDGVGRELLKRQVNWYTKLVSTMTLWGSATVQVAGNYTSPVIIPQGESVAVYYVDVGFRQRIMKGKGRLGVTLTDIFNTQKYGFIISDDNFHFSRIFKLDTRAVMLTFGYTFGAAFRESLMENRFKNE